MIFHQNIQLVFMLLAFVPYTRQQVKDPEFMAKLKKINEDCAAEEQIDLAVAQKEWSDNIFPDDSKLKCFYKCMNVKLGVIDSSGEVVDEALAFLASHFNDVATEKEIVEECGPIKGADLCETAYKLMKCIKAAKLD